VDDGDPYSRVCPECGQEPGFPCLADGRNHLARRTGDPSPQLVRELAGAVAILKDREPTPLLEEALRLWLETVSPAVRADLESALGASLEARMRLEELLRPLESS
jgi:hypothetical protein